MKKIFILIIFLLFLFPNFLQAQNVPPAPKISNIQVNIKPEATWTLIVVGSSFGNESGTVKVNGTAYSISSWTTNEIKAEIPAEILKGTVQVITSDNQETSVTYTLNIIPTISGVNPASATPGAQVNIFGYKFGSTSGKVLCGTEEATVIAWSSYEISIKLPKNLLPGTINLYILTASEGSSDPVKFTILSPPPPSINYLFPSSATIGTTISINGSNFGDEPGTISLNGQNIPAQSWSNQLVEFVLPENAQNGDVVISNLYGKSNPFPFSVIPLPVIEEVSPLNIIPGITKITILGSGFKNNWYTGSDVYFNGLVTDQILEWSDTKIIALAPANATAGLITLKIIGFPSFISGPSYQIKSSIDFVTPDKGKIGDKITLKGKSFGNKKGKIKVGKTEAEIINWSDTNIEITVPAGATSEGITIITASNIVNDPIAFSVLPIISDDPYSHFQYYLSQTKTVDSWKYTKGSSDIIVAVIDDGIDINHPDLTANIWKNKKEIAGNGKDDDNNGFVDDIIGWNFVNNNNELSPRGSHGTSVASIIGAVGNNKIGISGINQYVKLMPLIVCSNESECHINLINQAIHYAVDNGAQFINLSLGGVWFTNTYTNAYDTALLYAFEHGVLVIAAAGNGDLISNQGRNLDLAPSSPVCNDGNQNLVIGVAAVDKNDLKTTWSDYGSKCIDLSAPGKNIFLAVPPAFDPNFNAQKNIIDYGYNESDGTSFAAPQVTGALALLKSLHPNWSNIKIRDTLFNNADNLDQLNPTYKGQLGKGRLNLLKAIESENPKNISRSKNSKKNKKLPEIKNLKIVSIKNNEVTLSWLGPINKKNIFRYLIYVKDEKNPAWRLLLQNGKLYSLPLKTKKINIPLPEKMIYSLKISVLYKTGKESEGMDIDVNNR